jgi:hypothetical protein
MVKSVAEEIRELGDRLAALYDKPTAVDEAGGYYTKDVFAMIEKVGVEQVMRNLLEFLDGDAIQAFVNHMANKEEE